MSASNFEVLQIENVKLCESLYTYDSYQFALSEMMIQCSRTECFRMTHPSFSTRIALIELPDPASLVAKIEEIALDKIITARRRLNNDFDTLIE